MNARAPVTVRLSNLRACRTTGIRTYRQVKITFHKIGYPHGGTIKITCC
jgi:hypothetical protein